MLTGPLGRVLAASLSVPALGMVPAAAAAGSQDQHSQATLAAIVVRYQPCATALSASDRDVLAAAFGATGQAGVPVATAAARVHTTVPAFARDELRAVRRLERAHRTGNCAAAATGAGAATGATGAVASFQASHPAPPAATTTSSGLSWTSPTELILLGVIVLALAALAYGLRRDFGRPRAAEWGPAGDQRGIGRLGIRRRRRGP